MTNNPNMTPADQSISFFNSISWGKALIWAGFLFLVYILKHFFFIMFMTFMISYLMRSLLVFLCSRIFGSPSRFYKPLCIIAFLCLITFAYQSGKYIFPKIAQQGQALVRKLSALEDSPQRAVDGILRFTVGQWLFEQQIGSPEDISYQHALEDYIHKGIREKEYDDFARLINKLDSHLERELAIKNQALADSSKYQNAKKLKESEPDQYIISLSEAYTRLFSGDDKQPFTIPVFRSLWDSFKKDSQSFSKTYITLVLNSLQMEERQLLDQESFRYSETKKLIQEWKQGQVAEKLEEQGEHKLLSLVAQTGEYLAGLIPALLALPFKLILSLMLSFFITFDIDRLAQGANSLKKSRFRHIYEEITPSLRAFASLIGRAFQAQGVIAIVNTLLTYALMKFLFIENSIFFAAIVFICSFIPVIGVVLSGAPICVMAIIQDGGSFMLALWIIVGILAVHFFETSYLNPKIVGTFLHLHPVLVLIILAIGEHFFSTWGLLLGLPVAVYIIRIVILGEGLPWQKVEGI